MTFVWHVYGLFDITTDLCYYVGGTLNYNVRTECHIAGVTHVVNYPIIRTLTETGTLYAKRLGSCEVVNTKNALKIEYYYWWKMILLGHPVQNHNPRYGWTLRIGKPPSNKGVPQSAEAIMKQRAGQTGKPHPHRGGHRSKESNEKRSTTQRGRKHSTAWSNSISVSRTNQERIIHELMITRNITYKQAQ